MNHMNHNRRVTHVTASSPIAHFLCSPSACSVHQPPHPLPLISSCSHRLPPSPRVSPSILLLSMPRCLSENITLPISVPFHGCCLCLPSRRIARRSHSSKARARQNPTLAFTRRNSPFPLHLLSQAPHQLFCELPALEQINEVLKVNQRNQE